MIQPPYIPSGSQLADRIVDSRRHIIPIVACRLRHSANQSAISGVALALAFDTEDFNTGGTGMHSTTVNNSRITFAMAGIYVVTFTGWFLAGAGNYRSAAIRLNNTTNLSTSQVGSSAVIIVTNHVQTIYRFVSGDYVEASVAQDSGGALNFVSSGSQSPLFTATWLSA